MNMYMIIDDTILIQVYATVLAGILIFFTIQRHFGWKEVFEEKSRKLRQLRDDARAEGIAYREELLRLEASRERNIRENPSHHTLPDVTTEFENEKKHLMGRIRMKEDDFERLNNNLNSLAKKYLDRRGRYFSLKTDEGILTVGMTMLIVASIIVLLVGSIIEHHPSLSGEMPPYAIIISVILFSIGIALLIGKVYLHGKDIDDDELMPEHQ